MALYCGNSEQEIQSGLISAIYDAALDPDKWMDFTQGLHQCLDGIQPILYIADTKSALLEKILVSKDWNDTLLSDYMCYFNEMNPWSRGLVQSSSIGKSIRGDQIISDRALKKTEFFNDFWSNYGDWTNVIGTVVHRDPNAITVFGLHCHEKIMTNEAHTLSRLAEQLSLHIQKAFEISRQLGHGLALKNTMEIVLENLAGAALVIGPDLQVRYANSAGQKLFQSGVLALDGRGRISSGVCAGETNALLKMLKKALAPLLLDKSARLVPLSRPLDHENCSVSLVARAMPLAGAMDRQVNRPIPISSNPQTAQALLLITDPAARSPVSTELLKQQFGLTPTEARLAKAVTGGMSIKGYAQAAGVTEGTARGQLKSVFAKTSTHRQAELVALLDQFAWPLRPNS